MQSVIDEKAQDRRKKEAFQSSLFSSLWLLLGMAIWLFLRWYGSVQGFWSAVLVILAILNGGAVVPVWILYKQRIKEIEGGEEDAAAQY